MKRKKIRLEPRMLDALDRVSAARPYSWRERTPRSMLIEEALREWAVKHDKVYREWANPLTRGY